MEEYLNRAFFIGLAASTGPRGQRKYYFLCGPELNVVELWAGRRPVGPSAPRGRLDARLGHSPKLDWPRMRII